MTSLGFPKFFLFDVIWRPPGFPQMFLINTLHFPVFPAVYLFIILCFSLLWSRSLALPFSLLVCLLASVPASAEDCFLRFFSCLSFWRFCGSAWLNEVRNSPSHIEVICSSGSASSSDRRWSGADTAQVSFVKLCQRSAFYNRWMVLIYARGLLVLFQQMSFSRRSCALSEYLKSDLSKEQTSDLSQQQKPLTCPKSRHMSCLVTGIDCRNMTRMKAQKTGLTHNL